MQKYEELEEIWNNSHFCFNMWLLKWIDKIDGNELIEEITLQNKQLQYVLFS